MSTAISGNFLITAPSLPGQTQATPDTPTDALRRLHMTGPAGEPYNEVVQLSATDLEATARQLDDERQSLETSFGRGSQADDALTKMQDLLKQVDDLVTTNGKSDTSHADRATNENKITDLLKQVADLSANAGTPSDRPLDGTETMTAGNQTIHLDAVTLKTLGRVPGNGRIDSLLDLEKGKALDTAIHRNSTAAVAHQSIQAALDKVQAMRDEIESFSSDQIRPRLGDIATTLDGLWSARSAELTSNDAAMRAATDIRAMLLSSATIAAAVGADGWDKNRVLALVTPAGTTLPADTSSTSSSSSDTSTSADTSSSSSSSTSS